MPLIRSMTEKLTGILENLVAVFFLGIFVLNVTLVVLRYGFNSSIIGANEMMNYLFIYTTSLGAAVSLGKNTHIRISFFLDLIPPGLRRTVSFFNCCFIGAFNGFLLVCSINWIHSTGSFESPVMRIPQWIVQISIPIGCLLAALYCLNHMAVLLLTPGGGQEQRENSC